MVTARFDLADGVEAVQRASLRQDAKILVMPNGSTIR
jgi:hypothetical protein